MVVRSAIDIAFPNIEVSIVSAEDLAPLSAGTSAETVMIKFGSPILTGQAPGWLMGKEIMKSLRLKPNYNNLH